MPLFIVSFLSSKGHAHYEQSFSYLGYGRIVVYIVVIVVNIWVSVNKTNGVKLHLH